MTSLSPLLDQGRLLADEHRVLHSPNESEPTNQESLRQRDDQDQTLRTRQAFYRTMANLFAGLAAANGLVLVGMVVLGEPVLPIYFLISLIGLMQSYMCYRKVIEIERERFILTANNRT